MIETGMKIEEVKEAGWLRLRAALFDLDGTIVDSVEVFYQILVEICRRTSLPLADREKVREVMRKGTQPWDLILPADIPDRDGMINQCHDIAKEIWQGIYRKEARVFPECLEVMRKIKEADMKIGIVSSGWDEGGEITRLLKEGGIFHLIDVMITRIDVPNIKPSADPINECLRRLKIPAEYAVYVGDSLVDIIAGREAGTMTIGVLTGASDHNDLSQENPDMIIESITDLPRIFDLQAMD